MSREEILADFQVDLLNEEGRRQTILMMYRIFYNVAISLCFCPWRMTNYLYNNLVLGMYWNRGSWNCYSAFRGGKLGPSGMIYFVHHQKKLVYFMYFVFFIPLFIDL